MFVHRISLGVVCFFELVHVCTQNKFGGSMYAVCYSVSVLTAMLFPVQFSCLFSQ